MKFDCIFEEILDFIDIDYTHLNKTIRYEQRPHGKWVERDDGDEIYGRYEKCTNCGEAIISTHMSYCGNCGAKMGEGEEQ